MTQLDKMSVPTADWTGYGKCSVSSTQTLSVQSYWSSTNPQPTYYVPFYCRKDTTTYG